MDTEYAERALKAFSEYALPHNNDHSHLSTLELRLCSDGSGRVMEIHPLRDDRMVCYFSNFKTLHTWLEMKKRQRAAITEIANISNQEGRYD